MSRRVPLPSDQAVADTLHAVLETAAADGTRPTVVELARRVGLSNSTFWRHYPDVANQLRDTARRSTSRPAGTEASSSQRAQERAATLIRDNEQLREHLELAAATIARLTLDNHQLRQALEAAQAVTGIHPRAHRPHPDGRSG